MVKTVYGKYNGQTILFARKEDSKWEALVPFNSDGEYIVEVYAEDMAGNTSYYCSILFAISGHEIKLHIVPRGYGGSAKTSGYSCDIVPGGYIGSAKTSEYSCVLVKGGYKIERSICCRDCC